LNARITEVEAKQATAHAEVEAQRSRARSIEDMSQRVGALQKYVEEGCEDLSKRLSLLGLKLDSIVQFAVNTAPLFDLQETTKTKLVEQQTLLQPGIEGALPAQLAKLKGDLAVEQATLDGPMRAHQEALAAQRAWEEEWAAAVGAPDKEESFRGKWHRLKNIPAQRAELAELRNKRFQLSVSILSTLHKRAEVLKGLFAPVQALVDDEPQIREALGVEFSVRFSFDAFATRLFDFIK
jgi:hypothetical protein